MVVFQPCTPTPVHAFSTIPLTDTLRWSISNEFNIGSFAQFGDPAVTLIIHDEPRYHGAVALQLRQLIDEDPGHATSGFAMIDSSTATQPHFPIWWVTTREESEIYTYESSHGPSPNPPISYPDEAYVLWKLHMYTQDLPISWINWDIANADPVDDIISLSWPYDPHAPQTPAYTGGLNFSHKADARGFYGGQYVSAVFPAEIDATDDIALRRIWWPEPDRLIRLKPAVAADVGLLWSWTAHYGPESPKEGDLIKLQQDWDWDSPKFRSGSGSWILRGGSDTMDKRGSDGGIGTE